LLLLYDAATKVTMCTHVSTNTERGKRKRKKKYEEEMINAGESGEGKGEKKKRERERTEKGAKTFAQRESVCVGQRVRGARAGKSRACGREWNRPKPLDEKESVRKEKSDRQREQQQQQQEVARE